LNVAIILGTVIAISMMLRPVLSDWWQVRRDNQLLEAESTAIHGRNGQIMRQIEALASPEGIESRAREQFGWVMPGDHAVNVVGVTSRDSSTALPDSITPEQYRPEIDWLTEAIDFLLGYEYPTKPSAPDDVVIGL
jgi:cell division protein FtsB